MHCAKALAVANEPVGYSHKWAQMAESILDQVSSSYALHPGRRQNMAMLNARSGRFNSVTYECLHKKVVLGHSVYSMKSVTNNCSNKCIASVPILCSLQNQLSYHSTVPASPENVTLTTTSSPLRVIWTIDPPDGLVSNYTIYVTRLERGNTVVNYTSADTQFDIPNLDPYELVEVSVSANNSAGEGPSSPGVRGRAREERKLRKVFLFYYSGRQVRDV